MDEHSVDTLQILAGLLWPFVQQFLKNSTWFKLLRQDTDGRNLAASMIVAAISTLAIHYKMYISDNGAILSINLQVLGRLAAHAIGQGLLQQLTYQATIKRDAQSEKILELLHQIAGKTESAKQAAA